MPIARAFLIAAAALASGCASAGRSPAWESDPLSGARAATSTASSPRTAEALQAFVADLDRYISFGQVKIAPERREAIISRWHCARLNGTEADIHDVLCWLEILAG